MKLGCLCTRQLQRSNLSMSRVKEMVKCFVVWVGYLTHRIAYHRDMTRRSGLRLLSKQKAYSALYNSAYKLRNTLIAMMLWQTWCCFISVLHVTNAHVNGLLNVKLLAREDSDDVILARMRRKLDYIEQSFSNTTRNKSNLTFSANIDVLVHIITATKEEQQSTPVSTPPSFFFLMTRKLKTYEGRSSSSSN